MSSQSADPGDVYVKAGAVVFALGALATLVTFVPLFLHLTPLPTAMYWLSMLMPAGFLAALTGLFLNARAQRRRLEPQQPARA
ncbi:hypothetical protein ACIG0C_17255 [Kitasatospora aureofaciens]|uniref:Integral membrane protein n=1 Tax=Kitasatospora aureofaciens TaxID=1894 RepID=A0A1E7N7C7_KITAU|nr:hypothetical protein [Kitasatospora aureofaciens]QEV00314.1 hypothetical protein CP971_14410 [Streptomyces viridifaciens]ARF79113.1 hypothetical protein B6264_09455 [Kitasatospora aureofaciens]OEV36585.1 hypothetical protein HS99_0029130 [Kitasatospora aureofaciens]UKZ06533.1 hypothetical protein BOQ63_021290 [Streptomyces viridifaciens]GGU82644.1 hypothetical protein GCM10010502_38290 [Kitasatospora aureofaciens]